MAWEISFSPRAVKSFKKLDTGEQRRVSKFLREVGALEDPRLRGKALTANKSGLLTLWTRVLSSLWLTLGTARRSTTNPLGPRFRRVHRFPSRDRGGGCRLWA